MLGGIVLKYDSPPPSDYCCEKCEAIGVGLFRDYQTFSDHSRLLCKACAEVDQQRTFDESCPHQIGWMVAAVPCENGVGWWGYSSVPQAGVDWWNGLPLTIGATP